jgi:hypothetical protein
VFSLKDQERLQAYSQYNLTRDEQRVILLGKDAHLLSTNEIIKALGIADVDEFRRIVETLRRKGIDDRTYWKWTVLMNFNNSIPRAIAENGLAPVLRCATWAGVPSSGRTNTFTDCRAEPIFQS